MTLVGMGLVFAALGLLMLAITILDKVFRPKTDESPMAIVTPDEGRDNTELAAVIAAAIHLTFSEEKESFDAQPVHVVSIQRRSGASGLWSCRFHTDAIKV